MESAWAYAVIAFCLLFGGFVGYNIGMIVGYAKGGDKVFKLLEEDARDRA